MKSVRCLLLLKFCVLSLASKPRSVNLALETTFEFNNKQDVAVIEKVRKFLDKIETAVDKKLAVRLGNDETHYEFTDFLRDLIATISTYDDNNLKSVFKILNDEVHNYKYRGSRFNEIMDNDNLRYHVINILRKTNEAPVQFLRTQLKKNLKALKRKRTDKQETSFLNFLNILYKRKSAETLKQTVENLKFYGKRSSDSEFKLKDIIKTAVRTLIYDRYSNLDENVRHDVKTWLETVAKTSNLKANNQSLKGLQEKKIARMSHMNRLRSTPRTYTFVTLYPEEIHFEVKKSLAHQTLKTSKPAWTERTVPNKNYFYLVKAIPSPVRANERVAVEEDYKVNTSSSSLEGDWRTHRRKVTSELWLARHVREKPVQKISKKTSQKNVNKEILRSSNDSDKWLRRTDQHEGDTNINEKNDTTTTVSASSIYLERIRKLETELNRMKVELTAKISSISNQLAAEVNKTVDEYSDYAEQDREIFLKELNSTPAAVTEVDDTKSPDEITLETTKADAVFRSKVNDTQTGNLTIKANKQSETNTKEVFPQELGSNFTFRALEDSYEVNGNLTNNVTTVEVKSTYETKNVNTPTPKSVALVNVKDEEEKKVSNYNWITKQPDKSTVNTTTATDTSNTTILDY